MKLGQKVSTISVLILVFAGFTAAQSTGFEIDSEDKTLWLNDGADDKTVNFRAVCSGANETVKDDSVIVWDGVREYSVERVNNTSDFRFDVSKKNTLGSPSVDVGSYQLLGRCIDNNNEERRIGPVEFEVDRLSVDIVNNTDTKSAYIGERLKLGVEVSSELGNMDLDRISGETPPSLHLETDSKQMTQIGTQQVISEQMVVSSENTIGTGFIEDDEDDTSGTARVELVYNERVSKSDKNGSRSYEVKVSDEIDVDVSRWHYSSEISPSKRVAENQLKDVNLTVKMRYEGNPVTPPGDDVSYAGHFYLDRSDNQDLGEYEWFSGGFVGTVEENGKTYGKYVLDLEKRPEFDIGTEPLKVMFETGETGKKNVADIIVRKKFTFEGRVSDSDSRASQTDFKLQSKKYVEEFETNARGFFSRRVLPSTYDLNLDFANGKFWLNGAELEPEYAGSDINYQYYKNPGQVDGVDLKGIDPINMMSVSFGYPFDSGSARIQYNPAKTEDPANVDVYECQRWNFWGEECISGWDKIDEEDVTIRPGSWDARFPVDPVETSEYGDEKNVLYSAYVVGTNSGLALDRIGLEDYRVPSNEEFDIEGRAVTKGQPIENADVEIQLLDGSQVISSKESSTDGEGVFSLSIKAPEPGNYSLKAEISKGAYRPYSETLDEEVEVYKKKSLEVELPEVFELTTEDTVKETLTVKNDGQVDFEEVSLAVAESDLNIAFSDEKFSLESGDQKEVTVSVKMPEGFCDPSCVQYPTSDIVLESDGFSEEYDLGVKVVESSSKSASTTTESSDSNKDASSSPLPATPAGKFLASQSSLNIALGLITVFSLALASAVKKKKGSENNERNARTVNLQRPKVEPAEGSDTEVDAVADNLEADDVDAIAQAMDEDEEEAEEEDDIDALAEAMEEEESIESEEEVEEDIEEEIEVQAEEAEEAGELSCDVCGEEFDTGSGLKLHKQAFH